MSKRPRWEFEAEFPDNKITPQFVKVSKRPDGGSFVTTFIALEGENAVGLYKILGRFYEALEKRKPGDPPPSGTGSGVLKLKTSNHEPGMWTGPLSCPLNDWDCVEEWHMNDMWPSAMCFGALDFSASDAVEIEVTWSFSRCEDKLNQQPTQST